MSDSYFVGDDMGDDDLGDLIGDDDLGDLIGDEMGRRQRRVQRVAKRHGMVAMPKQKLQQQIQQAALQKAARTGMPQTVGGKLAASDQRLEVLPIGTAALAAAVNSLATLQVNVQRPIQAYRLILQVADDTTGADQLASCGVLNIVLGAHNLFASPGIIAPATGFGRDAWGTEILSIPMAPGGVVTINLRRLTATAQPGTATAMLFGFSAST